jgi:hypothetical protein
MTVPVLTPPTLPLPAASGGLPPRLRVVRVLLLVEVVLALMSTAESAVVATLGFGSPVSAVLTGLVAAVLALVTRRFGRGDGTRGRRAVLAVQWVLLAAAAVDLVIAALQQVPPLLVPTLVRWVVPGAVVLLLRRQR